MSNKAYDLLNNLAAIGLPALSVLIIALGEIWGIPLYIEISATVMAIDAFLGAVLKSKSKNYHKSIGEPIE